MAYKPVATRTSLYMMSQPLEAEQRVAAWCDEHRLNYTLAEFSAAWRLAPNVRYSQAVINILDDGQEPWLARLKSDLGAKTAETGANLVIGQTNDPGWLLGACAIDGLRVASPVLVYLELTRRRGRGEEAAAAVFEKWLLPWFAPARR